VTEKTQATVPSLLGLAASALLDRFASPDPTPGGGSAAALAGALGAALVGMVCDMPKTRNGSAEDRDRMATARGWAVEAGSRLRALVDEDSAAYDDVVAAYRRPKDTEEEKASRKRAIALAMAGAAAVPLRTAEACLVVVRAAGIAKAHGNPNAQSDSAIAAGLARAGLLGAVENVRANATGRPELAEVLERAEAVLAEGRAQTP
jgi:formiminotetrahydrofolate cyclodeaminase